MTVDELQVLITANTNELRKEIGKANKNISGLSKSASKSAGGVTSAFKTLKKGIVALGIGKVIKDSVQSGMDAIESNSLFETVMGNNASAVKEWSNGIADALGLNAVAMQKNIGVIYNMTSSMGVAGENALKMSKGVSVLAEDMASFYNLDSEEAFNKLRAGLTGETEPLKALGILVDENTVKQVAYSQGIAEVGAELTNEQKVMARYVAILQQTGNAQGDLARTLNSPSNQLRSLKQNVQNLGIAFSNFLIPVLQTVLPWLNALAKVATNALNSLASFLGYTGGSGASGETETISENVGAVGDGLDDATKNAKKLKGALAGFDEMNVLSDNSESSDSGGGTTSTSTVGLDFDLSEYNAHLDWVEGSTNDLVKKIEGIFSSIGNGIKFDNLTKAFGNLKKSLDKLTSKMWDGLKWGLDNVLNPLAKWTIEDALPSFLNSLSNAVNGVGLIDFAPVQEKLLMLRDSVAPFINNVGTGLDWFLQNVLVPLAAFVIEDVVPAFLKILSGAIDIVNQAIEDIKPIFKWFWDNVLQPIAEWTGGVFVTILNGIGDALKWIADNEIAMIILESIAAAIGLVAAALVIYNVAMGVCNVVTGVFSGIMAVLTSPITLVVAAIAAVIAIIVLCIKYWDEISAAAKACWEGIKGAWNAVADWFNNNIIQPVANFFKNLWNGFANGAKNAWEGVKNVFSAVGGFFKDIFSKAWQGVVSVFSAAGEIFVNIKDGIVSVFKLVVNGLIDGINTVVKLPFEGLNKILDKLHDLTILKVQPFKWLTWRAPVPQLPKLARGGVVDSPTHAIIGEAGAEAVMPLERNTGWIDQLADKLADKIGGGGGDIKLTVKLGEDTIFDKFIEYGREKAFETNGEVVFA